MQQDTSRRNFIKLSSAGIGGLLMSFQADTKGRLAGIPSSKSKKLKIVCVGAHPGDPEFGCGGTMARYSDAGHLVTFLYLTRGEAFDEHKTHKEAAELRTREADVACKVLNTVPRFVGQIDGDTVLSHDMNQAMLDILQDEQPDMVFSQWPIDGHMDHQVAGLLALNAWMKMKKTFELYFYEVNTGSETMAFTPSDYVDISGVMKKKHDAMYAHQSQEPDRTYKTFFKQMEDFRGLEAGVPAAEAFVHFGSKTSSDIIMFNR